MSNSYQFRDAGKALAFRKSSAGGGSPVISRHGETQDRYAPKNRCFGCGPANEKGLRIKSFVSESGDEIVAEWRPERHHEAFDGALNGGITASLLDCHSNWAATYHLMRASGAEAPPSTVTADLHVTYKPRLRRPAP